MTRATKTNVKAGTKIVSRRNCTSIWYEGRVATIVRISSDGLWVYFNDTGLPGSGSLSTQFLNDFDIVEEESDKTQKGESIAVLTKLMEDTIDEINDGEGKLDTLRMRLGSIKELIKIYEQGK